MVGAMMPNSEGTLLSASSIRGRIGDPFVQALHRHPSAPYSTNMGPPIANNEHAQSQDTMGVAKGYRAQVISGADAWVLVVSFKVRRRQQRGLKASAGDNNALALQWKVKS